MIECQARDLSIHIIANAFIDHEKFDVLTSRRFS